MWPMLKNKNCNTGTTRGSHDVWCFPYLFLLIATYKVSKTPCGPVSLASHRLVYAMSAWSVKTRRALSRHCRDARVYGYTSKYDYDYAWDEYTHLRIYIPPPSIYVHTWLAPIVEERPKDLARSALVRPHSANLSRA